MRAPVLVVINHEDSPENDGRWWCRAQGNLWDRLAQEQGQAYDERAALADSLTAGQDCALVQSYKLVHESEPDANSAFGASLVRTNLGK